MDANKSILTNGTLTIIVSIKPNVEYYCQTKQQPSLGHNKLIKLINEKEMDVSFKVGRRVFYAHKSIFKAMAPELYLQYSLTKIPGC